MHDSLRLVRLVTSREYIRRAVRLVRVDTSHEYGTFWLSNTHDMYRSTRYDSSRVAHFIKGTWKVSRGVHFSTSPGCWRVVTVVRLVRNESIQVMSIGHSWGHAPPHVRSFENTPVKHPTACTRPWQPHLSNAGLFPACSWQERIKPINHQRSYSCDQILRTSFKVIWVRN